MQFGAVHAAQRSFRWPWLALLKHDWLLNRNAFMRAAGCSTLIQLAPHCIRLLTCSIYAVLLLLLLTYVVQATWR
eukprot:12092-Heterococcus_DN1.PRE.2